MAKHNAKVIDSICELLYNAAVEHHPEYAVHVGMEFDPMIRATYITCLVSQDLLPKHLREQIDGEVERQVAAFYRDLDVVCKAADDDRYGRCFVLNPPPQLRPGSWDDFRNRRPKEELG